MWSKYIPPISHNQEVSVQMEMANFTVAALSQFHWSVEHQILSIHRPRCDSFIDSFHCNNEAFPVTGQALTEQIVNSQQNKLTQKWRIYMKLILRLNSCSRSSCKLLEEKRLNYGTLWRKFRSLNWSIISLKHAWIITSSYWQQ